MSQAQRSGDASHKSMSSDRIDTNNKLHLLVFKTKSNSKHFDEWESYHIVQTPFFEIQFVLSFVTHLLNSYAKKNSEGNCTFKIPKKETPDIKLDWTPHLKFTGW